MLDPRVAAAFYGRFPSLRPPQQAAIEPLTAGHDVVLCSGTGSGKTEAVLAPLVSRYFYDAVDSDTPVLLYVAPTKALINDLERRMALPLSALGWKASIRHGDRDDTRLARVGQVLLTTPESLDVLLFRRDNLLKEIRACIIDEAHLLYNTQRGLQLAILLRRTQSLAERSLQLAALSATVGNLKALARFLMGEDRSPDLLSFAADRPIDAQIRLTPRVDDFADVINRLLSSGPTKLLCFANSRRECERLVEAIRTTRPDCAVLTHYSSLSPEERLRTEHSFLQATKVICVATSTLELGVDIGDIDAVVLWGAPATVESLLQRIGRGNRRSSKTNLIAFVPDSAKHPLLELLVFLAQVDAAKRGLLPESEAYALFGAVGQQCLSVIGSHHGAFTRVADLHALLSGHSHLTQQVVEQILDELAAAELCQRHGFLRRYGATEALHQLVEMRLIYGNMPVGAQEIELCHGGANLGAVPRANLLRLSPGVQVRFAGRRWVVTKASTERIEVQPARGTGPAVDLRYNGRMAGMDPFVASLVWKQLQGGPILNNLMARSDHQALKPRLDRLSADAGQNALPYTVLPQGRMYVTCAGQAVNRVLAHFLDEDVDSATDVALLARRPVDWSRIPTDPNALRSSVAAVVPPEGDLSLYQARLPPSLAEEERVQPWLKDPTVGATLTRLATSELRAVPAEPLAGFAIPES